MAIGVHMETNPSALGPVTQDGEEKTEGERGTQREMNGNGTRAVPLMHRLPSRLRLHLLDRLLLQLGNLLGRGHALVAICLYHALAVTSQFFFPMVLALLFLLQLILLVMFDLVLNAFHLPRFLQRRPSPGLEAAQPDRRDRGRRGHSQRRGCRGGETHRFRSHDGEAAREV